MNTLLNKKTTLFLIIIFIFVNFFGCAHIDRATSDKDIALSLIQKYEDAEATYKNYFKVASETEREFMIENVAPYLDKSRVAITEYSKLVAKDKDAEQKRIEAIFLIRQAMNNFYEH